MKASESDCMCMCTYFDSTGLMFTACVEKERKKNVHLQAKVVVKASLKVTEEKRERSEGSAHYSLLACTTRE